MTNRKMTLLTSLGVGVFILAVMYIFNGIYYSLFGGVIAFILTFTYMSLTFKKSEDTKLDVLETLRDETVKYIDTAGLMTNGSEAVGALAVTEKRVYFEYGTKTAKSVLDLLRQTIKTAECKGGFLVITDNENYVYTFKVFSCDTIIKVINI